MESCHRPQPPQFGLRRFILVFISCLALPLAFEQQVAPARALAEETASLAKLTYLRVLKGSVPEWIAVSVDSSGAGTYDGRRVSDPASPRPLKLSPGTTQNLFRLAHALNDFQNMDLESHKKVADLGQKTLIYEAEGRRSQVEFNYTLRREAQELVDLFERIASVEQHIETLQFSIKYDHLSLPQELLRIQIDLQNKALAEPELMVPTLEEIARNPRLLHLAQARAQNILEHIQGSNN